MSDEPSEGEVPKKASKLPLLAGAGGAIAAAAAGFFLVPASAPEAASGSSAEMHGAVDDQHDTAHADTSVSAGNHGDSHASDGHGGSSAMSGYQDATFVALEPVVISLPDGGHHSHLRFVAQLEVNSADAEQLQSGMPRVIDIMNSYLRVIHPEDFDKRQILSQIRVHLVARINAALGQPIVKDVLIMEFLLS